MAVLHFPDKRESISDPKTIAESLSKHGITYEQWEPAHPVASDAPAQEILDAYRSEINRLMEEGNYVTADVIDLFPDTPNLDMMLQKFAREHWHDEDEVRFTIEGKGLFHIHPKDSAVLSIEVEPGDLLRVPRGTHHWFDLCENRRIRAIRLFQDPSGWTPHYTDSGVDAGYEPICFGPRFLPRSSTRVENKY